MTVANAVLQGIFLGAFYAVLACGLSIMFGVMRIINLAHGDIAVLGAYIVYVIVERTGVSAFVAFAVGKIFFPQLVRASRLHRHVPMD